MNYRVNFTLLLIIFTFLSCKSQNLVQNMSNPELKSHLINTAEIPCPVAKKEPVSFSEHGITRSDDYYWMRLSDEQKEADVPDARTRNVIDYLEHENRYREECMKPLADFENKLFEEMKSRIKQTDMSVPYYYEGYYYITRYDEGKEYPVYTRKKGSQEATEEILLDVNELAQGHEYYNVGGRVVSPDNQMLAYSDDILGRRQYTIRIKNLITGVLYPDEIKNTTGSITWGNDNKTLFYTMNDEALRSYKIFRHELGTDSSSDVMIYHEKDETFSTYIYKTKSKKYLIIGNAATLSNEYHVLEADNPTGTFRLFQGRERDLEFEIDHYENNWYILTNTDGAKNFKIMSCPEYSTDKKNWKDFMVYDSSVFTSSFEIFKDFMVISERKNGMTAIKIRPWNHKGEHYILFDEPAFTVYTGINPEFNTSLVRVEYTSMTTPPSTYDYNIKDKSLTLLKQQEVLGEFNAMDYVSERTMVKADDGTMVPLSIVYKKGFERNGSHPLLLYGYGSYGASMDPYFSSARLSLLNRGFVFAIAHVRGGQEMGRQWYEDGKFFRKKNTFTDFIDCGEYLIREKYAAKNLLFAQGGSAGGLLMGAVINMKPELWKGVIADVPFVDVINTMLDESIPLTTGEFDEWGNPKQKDYFEYMLSYSPYDNVKKTNYPALFVTTGYWDSQVQYWEPAKWVAKLRDYKTDKNPLLMYCNMDTGHGGASGRFRRLKEVAMEYTFLLDLAGRTDR